MIDYYAFDMPYLDCKFLYEANLTPSLLYELIQIFQFRLYKNHLLGYVTFNAEYFILSFFLLSQSR